MIHIDGAHVTTKRNWLVATISLIFLFLWLGVVRPNRTTSEPFEHSIANTRAIKRDFNILDLTHTIRKMDRLWVTVADGNLKTSRDVYETRGYAATLAASSNVKDKKQVHTNKESTAIETNMDKLELLNNADECGWSVVSELWPTIRKIINRENENMKELLTGNFGVMEHHPMMDMFLESDMPEKMIEQLETMLTNKDNDIFKFEECNKDAQDEFEGERQANLQDTRTEEELSFAVRDQMVANIISDLGTSAEDCEETVMMEGNKRE